MNEFIFQIKVFLNEIIKAQEGKWLIEQTKKAVVSIGN